MYVANLGDDFTVGVAREDARRDRAEMVAPRPRDHRISRFTHAPVRRQMDAQIATRIAWLSRHLLYTRERKTAKMNSERVMGDIQRAINRHRTRYQETTTHSIVQETFAAEKEHTDKA